MQIAFDVYVPPFAKEMALVGAVLMSVRGGIISYYQLRDHRQKLLNDCAPLSYRAIVGTTEGVSIIFSNVVSGAITGLFMGCYWPATLLIGTFYCYKK